MLFVMAENVLPAEQLDTMYQAFERHEEEVIGHGRHEELHELLHRLRDKYAA